MKFGKYLNEDNVTVAVCILALCIGFYALQSDFSFFGGHRLAANGERGPSVGTVSSVESDVRLRTSKNIFWANAQKDDVVDQGDSLFVGPGSSITVNFEDGKSITIGANSLIKFKTENKKVTLSLQYGSIKSANLPSQLVLDDCGKSVDIKADNADLEIGKSTECGKIQVKANKGDVKVNDQTVALDDKDFTIAAPAPAVKLVEKPVVNEAAVKMETLQPEDLAQMKELQDAINNLDTGLAPPQLVKEKKRIIASLKFPPTAQWKKEQDAQEYIVETADNPEFKNSKTSRTPASIQPLDTTSDQIFYRVKSVNAKNATSDYSKTGVIEVVYPDIKPKEQIIKYNYLAKNSKDVAKAKDFSIKWNEVPTAEKYVVQVDKDPEFKDPKEYTTRSPASIVKVPGEGNYNYRIIAYNSNDRKISSMSEIGEIVYNRIFDLQTPLIEKSYAALTYFFQKGLGKFIWLKWDSEIKQTQKYRVEIAKDKKFSDLVKTYYSKRNRVLVQEPLPEGHYFWRVRSESADNESQVSDWSKFGSIDISSGQL